MTLYALFVCRLEKLDIDVLLRFQSGQRPFLDAYFDAAQVVSTIDCHAIEPSIHAPTRLQRALASLAIDFVQLSISPPSITAAKTARFSQQRVTDAGHYRIPFYSIKLPLKHQHASTNIHE